MASARTIDTAAPHQPLVAPIAKTTTTALTIAYLAEPVVASKSWRLGYFPKPYPEEIMYSVLARFSSHVGHPSPERVSELLFGVVRRRRNILFSSKLGFLASKLPNTDSLNAYTMLNDHTIFPYYATFMKPARRAAAIEQRIGKNETSNSFSSNGWKWLLADNQLRFCPECVVDMRVRYGELYWRRDHHIPTVLVCPEHGCTLLRADMSKAGTRGWCAATAETCPDAAPFVIEDLTEDERCTLREIATRSVELLRGNLNILSRSIDPKAYQDALVARGLGWGSTFSDPSRLRAEVVEHFGHLARIWPAIFDITNVTDPVTHILLSMLLDRMPTLRPAFGSGPWPCPNRLAAHVSEMPVTRVVRTRASEDPVFGKFYCSCGCVYVRSESRDGKLSRPKFIVFGETLRPLLVRAASEKWAIRRTSKAAGISPGALVTQARAMGFSCPWEVSWHQPKRKALPKKMDITVLGQTGPRSLE